MSKIAEIIKNIKSTNNFLNTQIELLTNNLDENVNSIVYKTQLDLITNICQDYNLNIKELSKKYLIKCKPGRKPKEITSNDSPTFQAIQKIKNDDMSDDNTDIDILVSSSLTDKKKTKVKKETKQIEIEENNEHNENKTDEIIYKTITIGSDKYLLDPKSDIIFDFENNQVGKKKDGKYLMKKV